jgi:hypothetical protein
VIAPGADELPAAPRPSYLDPAEGIDAVRDATAAIACVAVGDGEGLHAILAGTPSPEHVAFAAVGIAAAICHRLGLDQAAISALLGEIRVVAADSLLDQRRPDATDGR